MRVNTPIGSVEKEKRQDDYGIRRVVHARGHYNESGAVFAKDSKKDGSDQERK